jgi:hypothetical protein
VSDFIHKIVIKLKTNELISVNPYDVSFKFIKANLLDRLTADMYYIWCSYISTAAY